MRQVRQQAAIRRSWSDYFDPLSGGRCKPSIGPVLDQYEIADAPINNWALTWEEVTLDPVKGTGNFELDQHKNVNKGIRAYVRLARPLVDYLLTIRPRNARGYIHPHPETGKPYTNIRKQWDG